MTTKKQTKTTQQTTKKEDVVVEEKVVSVVKESKSNILEQTYQLTVHELKILEFPKATSVITIENLGGGDLYVSTQGFVVSTDSLVLNGNKKEVESKVLYVTSDCRPTIKVSYSE